MYVVFVALARQQKAGVYWLALFGLLFSTMLTSAQPAVAGTGTPPSAARRSAAALRLLQPVSTPAFAQQAYLKASNTGAGDQLGMVVAIAGDTAVIGAPLEDSNVTGVNGNGGNNSASNAGAAYVFVRTGGIWTQQAYLKASNTGANDSFGSAVAISGNTIVVGAPLEDSNATTVNGNGADNSASNAGAAYIFVRTGTTWSQQAYLKPSNNGAGDGFGQTVAIDGDTVIVGARLEDSNATTVNGNAADNSASNAGAAYIFVRNSGAWSQQAYLKANNSGATDNFGQAVAISGNSVIVGADGEDSNATGVNGNGANNSATNAGAAYIFVRNGTGVGGTWSQQAYLKAANAEAGDFFGRAVAIAADTVVIGAGLEDSNATTVNGNSTDNSAAAAGAAYVFVRTSSGAGGTWSQQAYLKAANSGAGDRFGAAVAVAGDRVVIGAPDEDSNATGVDGDGSNNSAANAGAAYLFVRSSGAWSQQAYLKAANTEAADNFGEVVAVASDTIVTGASQEDSNATTINGEGNNNAAAAAGAAYVFALTPEIDLQGNGVSIVHGDSTPATADQTDFGSAMLGGSGVMRTFTVVNSGAGPLYLTGSPLVALSGTNAGAFTLTRTPASSVAAGNGSTTFDLTFMPSVVGVVTATVSIANNDRDETPYTFVVQGNGVGAEIDLQGKGQSIPSGTNQARGANDTDFGTVAANGSSSRTFTIQNSGNVDLTLSGSPVVTLSGARAGAFSLTRAPANRVAVGGNSTFDLAFTPNSGVGIYTATVSIANNDNNENPYTFVIQGSVAAPPPAQIATIGRLGDTNGLLRQPLGIAVESSGNFYVIDSGNKRVQKFSSTGAYALQWGSSGTGNGQFSIPSGVAVDSSGNVYVTDRARHRVQKFNSNGGYLAQWGSRGSAAGQFNTPNGVAVDSSGNIYVADTLNHRIQKFNSSGGNLAQWGSLGSGARQFNSPTGVAVDSSGNIYVADTLNHRIQKLNSNGLFLTAWGVDGNSAGQFTNPTGVAVDSNGNVYVADSGNHRIQQFTNSGAYLSQWGANGRNAGQFNTPYEVAVNRNGYLFVADQLNQRIQIFGNAPGIVVNYGNGLNVPSGTAHIIPFANAVVNSSGVTHTFTISNPGQSNLILSGNPLVTISGANANAFRVTTLPAATIPPGGSTSFAVIFAPTTLGAHNATVSIANNSLQNPFTFAIQGTGTAPEIDLQGNNVSIASGDTTPAPTTTPILVALRWAVRA